MKCKNQKYEFTGETKTMPDGAIIHRIRAVVTFGRVSAGEIGGWIETPDNLSMAGNARVEGNARVTGNADYVVFKNCWSSYRWFTYTRSNRMWRVGCFFGTGEELIKKAYKDSETSGRCYEAIVRAMGADRGGHAARGR